MSVNRSNSSESQDDFDNRFQRMMINIRNETSHKFVNQLISSEKRHCNSGTEIAAATMAHYFSGVCMASAVFVRYLMVMHSVYEDEGCTKLTPERATEIYCSLSKEIDTYLKERLKALCPELDRIFLKYRKKHESFLKSYEEFQREIDEIGKKLFKGHDE